MAERTEVSVDERLHHDATARLLEWGFSPEEIARYLGHSEVWVREVQEEDQRLNTRDRPTER